MTLGIGETTQIQGSGAKPYTIKNVDGAIWSCTCPGWRNCKGPVITKTCKHLRAVNPNEAARVALAMGQAAPIATTLTQVGTTTARISTAAPNVAVAPRDGQTPAQQYKQSLIDNAAAEGRNLRQDEKAKIFGPPILLAHKWDGEMDPTGHLLSEKRDGCRAYWDGKDFISRQGNKYEAPIWFKTGLPNHPLDGELIMGRKLFAETISVIKSANSGEAWKKIRYEIFDAPSHPGGFEERINHCKQVVKNAPYATVLDQVTCTGVMHLKQELARIEALGGEGVMIRKAGSAYEIGRSYTLLKVKSFFDCEGTVQGYLPGKGRLKGVVGSLECRLPSGVIVSVGSGLSDALRQNPPQLGAIITIRYQELSKDGVPRVPVFVSVRDYE